MASNSLSLTIRPIRRETLPLSPAAADLASLLELRRERGRRGSSAPPDKEHRIYTYNPLGSRTQFSVIGFLELLVTTGLSGRIRQHIAEQIPGGAGEQRLGLSAVHSSSPAPSTLASPGSPSSLGPQWGRDWWVPDGGPRHPWATSAGMNKRALPFSSETG